MSQSTATTRSGHSLWKGLFLLVLLIYVLAYICGFGIYILTAANAHTYAPPSTLAAGYTIDPCRCNGHILSTRTAYEHFLVQNNLNQSTYFNTAVKKTLATTFWEEGEYHPKSAARAAIIFWYILYLNNDLSTRPIRSLERAPCRVTGSLYR